jgi:hypothetical protein
MSSWKAAESRIGVWYGAKGIKKSGRQALSGGNSGQTRGDSPHRTVFIESKRDKSYHSVIKLWREYKAKEKCCKKSPFIVTMPVVVDGKVVKPSSDIWLIHKDHFEQIADMIADEQEPIKMPWKGLRPRALTLYEETLTVKESTVLDRHKAGVTCNFVYHGHPGFWIMINKNFITKCWKLILEERKFREELIKEEEEMQ